MKKLFTLALMCIATVSSFAETLNVNGTNRNMIVYAPSNLPQNRPLVISMHGYNQDAGYQQSQAKWELVADTAKFVVVYPDGINRAWDINGSSDLNFLEKIINTMYDRYKIDKSRVYLNGFSMGGMMTYYAARTRPDLFSAFAPVSSPSSDVTTPNNKAVPIIHSHGTADNYGGIYDFVKHWAAYDGCNTSNDHYIEHYPTSKPNSGSSFYRWTGGRNGTEVALLAFKDKGHWYSMDTSCALTSVEVWNFCKRYANGVMTNDNGGSSYQEVTTVPNGETSIGATNYRTWNGVGANASAVAILDNNYKELASVAGGTVVYGDGDVNSENYADLTGYTTIKIYGTDGVQVRALFNRAENKGDYIEKTVTIQNGVASINLAEVSSSYVHLNAMKTGWGSSEGKVNIVSLVGSPSNPNSGEITAAPSGETSVEGLKFWEWNGVGANAEITGALNNNFKNGTVAGGALLWGDGDVIINHYTDLTGYNTLKIYGSNGVQLRALFNRQTQNDEARDFVEKTATIENGVAVFDLSDITPYVHLNAIKTGWGSAEGKVTVMTVIGEGNNNNSDSSFNGGNQGGENQGGENQGGENQGGENQGQENMIVCTTGSSETNLQDVEFYTWNTNDANSTATNSINSNFNIGEVGAGSLLFGDQNVHYLNYSKLNGYTKLTIYGTDGIQVRALFNRQEDESFTEKSGTIENGKFEINLSEVSSEFVYLNAIKTGWGSPEGSISKIALTGKGNGAFDYYFSGKGTLSQEAVNALADENAKNIDATALTNTSAIALNAANSNCLIYVNNANALTNTKNVVVKNGNAYTAQNIELTSNGAFFAPVDIQAANAKCTVNVQTINAVCIPFNAAVPAGFKAYEINNVEAEGSTYSVINSISALTANKPALIFGEGQAVFSSTNATIKATDELKSGDFIGVYEQTAPEAGSYVFTAAQGGGAAYTQVISNSGIVVDPFYAYISKNASESMLKQMNFLLGGGDPTAIGNIEAASKNIKGIFNVNGTQNKTLKPGFNIIKMANGQVKKVFINK